MASDNQPQAGSMPSAEPGLPAALSVMDTWHAGLGESDPGAMCSSGGRSGGGNVDQVEDQGSGRPRSGIPTGLVRESTSPIICPKAVSPDPHPQYRSLFRQTKGNLKSVMPSPLSWCCSQTPSLQLSGEAGAASTPSVALLIPTISPLHSPSAESGEKGTHLLCLYRKSSLVQRPIKLSL